MERSEEEEGGQRGDREPCMRCGQCILQPVLPPAPPPLTGEEQIYPQQSPSPYQASPDTCYTGNQTGGMKIYKYLSKTDCSYLFINEEENLINSNRKLSITENSIKDSKPRPKTWLLGTYWHGRNFSQYFLMFQLGCSQLWSVDGPI